MATNAILSFGGLSTNGGPPYVNVPTDRGTLPLTGEHACGGTLDCSTSPTAIPIGGGIGTPGLWTCKNLDPTNDIQIGVVVSGTFYPLILLKAGDPTAQPGRLAITAPYAKAVAGTPVLEYDVLEE